MRVSNRVVLARVVFTLVAATLAPALVLGQLLPPVGDGHAGALPGMAVAALLRILRTRIASRARSRRIFCSTRIIRSTGKRGIKTPSHKPNARTSRYSSALDTLPATGVT